MAAQTVDGIEFHVQRLGRWHAPSSAPVVLVHGLFTGSMASWFFTCAPGIGKDRGVFLYDLRGHGRTPRPDGDDFTSSTQARDLGSLTVDLPPFHLVGHSFGALVAIRFALAHPGRVRSVTLVEPPVRADGDGAPAWWWSTATVEASRADDLGRSRPSGPPADLIAAIRRSLDGEVEVSDDDLAALPAPLAFVTGDHTPAAATLGRIARVRPDATTVVFPAGHAVQVDAREDLTAFLRRFLGAADDDGVAYG